MLPCAEEQQIEQRHPPAGAVVWRMEVGEEQWGLCVRKGFGELDLFCSCCEPFFSFLPFCKEQERWHMGLGSTAHTWQAVPGHGNTSFLWVWKLSRSEDIYAKLKPVALPPSAVLVSWTSLRKYAWKPQRAWQTQIVISWTNLDQGRWEQGMDIFAMIPQGMEQEINSEMTCRMLFTSHSVRTAKWGEGGVNYTASFHQ